MHGDENGIQNQSREDGEKQFLNVVKLLPESLPSGKRILWEDLGNGLFEISVDKHSAKGGNAKPIVIKRFVQINDDLFRLFGLWFGDGIKIQAKENTFGFSNTEIALHKEFLRLSGNVFGLETKQFRCNLQFISEDFISEEQIRKRISQELRIPLKNFWKSRINEKRNTVGIDIRTDSRIWGVLLAPLFEKIKEMVFQNKNFSAVMLQGIIASEANVHVRSDSGRLGEISIAAEGEDKRNFIRQLLINLDIQPSKDKTIEHQESVLIHGLSNFRKVKEWNLIALHPKKLEAFELGMKGFKKEEFRKGECKFLVLQILSNERLSVKEIAKKLNRRPRTINDAVAFLERKNFIKRVRNGRNILWEITDDGLTFLKNNGSINELRNNF